MKKCFEYRHIVSFEETNLVGNVYFVNHIKWQGKCRELILFKYVPNILTEIENGSLAMVTLKCSCEYFDELKAFDEIILQMRLDDINRNRIKMDFDYFKLNGTDLKLVAKGSQEVACMKKEKNILTPTDIPDEFKNALTQFLT